jgi:hypothetical protein
MYRAGPLVDNKIEFLGDHFTQIAQTMMTSDGKPITLQIKIETNPNYGIYVTLHILVESSSNYSGLAIAAEGFPNGNWHLTTQKKPNLTSLYKVMNAAFKQYRMMANEVMLHRQAYIAKADASTLNPEIEKKIQDGLTMLKNNNTITFSIRVMSVGKIEKIIKNFELPPYDEKTTRSRQKTKHNS